MGAETIRAETNTREEPMTDRATVTTAETETITAEIAETTKTTKKFKAGETTASEARTEAGVTTDRVTNTINTPPPITTEEKIEDSIEVKTLKNLGNKQFQQVVIKTMISPITPIKMKD